MQAHLPIQTQKEQIFENLAKIVMGNQTLWAKSCKNCDGKSNTERKSCKKCNGKSNTVSKSCKNCDGKSNTVRKWGEKESQQTSVMFIGILYFKVFIFTVKKHPFFVKLT